MKMPIRILGPAIPPIDAPQGATLKCSFTFKNTGNMKTKFQAVFSVKTSLGTNGWGLPITDPVVTDGLNPGESATKDIYGSVRPDAPIGTAQVKLEVTDVVEGGMPGTKVYDKSEGTINVIVGTAAQIISVNVQKV